MSFRKEKKFRVSIYEMLEIKKKLISEGMISMYPSRIIKSYYFDNDRFQLFNESEEGVLPRRKIRVRWYNDILDLSKETKISSYEGRFKQVKKIGTFTKESDILKLSYLDQEYGLLRPSISVSYERFYYKIKSLRITFDRNIIYQPLTSHIMSVFEDPECVLEVKVPFHINDKSIEEIIPFTTSRFSKYSRGIIYLGNTV
ncbi:VTC domain-containing protein [Alphaproteobacteria bacterium]|nr:VTC domain-containing protein [Alphaproteobacteria bacterium]